MRYCFFASGPYRENPSLVRALCLGKELAGRGVDVCYVADDIPENRRPGVFDARATIAYVTKPRSSSQFLARRRAIASLSPDYVHVIDMAPKTFLGLVGSKWKVVADYDEWPAGRPHPFLRRKWEEFLERWSNRRAARVIVCSRYLQDRFEQRHGRRPAYIPYATHLEEHADADSPFAEPTAVYMGTFSKPYDLDLLFHAAKLLAERKQKPRMCFMGTGPQFELWKAFLVEHQLDNVELTGRLTGVELWRRLRHSHVLLFPIRPSVPNLSRCPSKTYSYAQARRPVIVNRTGEIPTVLGDLATYVECTPESFAEAIGHAMRSPVLPDVDYHVEHQNWGVRAERLLELLA
jgi:glycosyltransferase involved in cell wall biosynthesis